MNFIIKDLILNVTFVLVKGLVRWGWNKQKGSHKHMDSKLNDIELKDLLDVVFDAITMEDDLIHKHWGDLIENSISLFKDIPNPATHIAEIKLELANVLGNPELQRDLVSYVEEKFSDDGSHSARAKEILAAALDMLVSLLDVVEKGLALKQLV